ncbi:MAG: DUF1861 family protein [Clostridiales bacterium]|nr:DUF1861 family protein [Clostridiales bacterium]
MFTIAEKAISCLSLVKTYEEKTHPRGARKLTFLGAEGLDVYNVSVPFQHKGKTYIAGRVEPRVTEWSSVRFFGQTGPDTYAALPEPVFQAFQDPFVTFIGGEMVLGVVQVVSDPLDPKRIVSWHTCFYKGPSPSELKLFAIGPSHMKDIRLCGLQDGRVAVFTRPQGKKGGLGKIGFMIFDSLNAVNGEDMLSAEISQTHFLPEEWGGANDVHILKNNLLGVAGHIARRDREGLHYHPMCYAMDPKTGKHSPLTVLARRADFPDGPAKRPELKDVLFTAGLIRHPGGSATLYTGASDCEALRAEIDDPFLQFER